MTGNSEATAAAVKAFLDALAIYNETVDTEKTARAASELASAQLATSTAQRESADTALESAVNTMLAALREIGINP